MSDYQDFLARKSQLGTNDGFKPTFLPSCLFDFQGALVEWSIVKGRGALFEDCGLGKTLQQLVWAENVVRETNKPVLVLTPLAVAQQTKREADKFDIEASVSLDGKIRPGINIANYERLHYFDQSAFAGAVCDESAILKSFDGARRVEITEFMRRMRYRLLCTATPSPNEYIELGTSSEALGYLGYMDMLSRFFKNDQGNSIKANVYKHKGKNFRALDEGAKWRFKGHAEDPFWKWVCSWARAVRKPSDLGFDDGAFLLPALVERQHMVDSKSMPEGKLFALPAVGLSEQREERRRTIVERCEKASQLVVDHQRSLIFCHLNDEGDLLEKLIPNSIQVSGSDDDETKTSAAEWFQGHRCICNDPKFRSKLSAWRTIENTSRNITGNIAQSALHQQNCTHQNGKRIGSHTIEPIMQQISTNGVSDPLKSRENTTPIGENGTPKTTHSERGSKTKRSQIVGSIRKRDGQEGFVNLDSRCQTTTEYLRGRKANVQFALEQKVETQEPDDTTLTTATHLEMSEVYCAPPAISGSENSGTIQTALTAPHCICGHQSGVRRLITKPVMFGYGLNFQCCNHIVTFPDHSFEKYYQSIRRCWRFGQKRPVTVDIVTTEGEKDVLANLQRKSVAADKMFAGLIRHMNAAQGIDRSIEFTKTEGLPSWL